MITLADGTQEWISNKEEMFQLVEDKLGYEAKELLSDMFDDISAIRDNDLDEMAQDINEYYQAQLHDVVDSLDEITDEFQNILSADRMNRNKLNEQVHKLKSVRNSIYKEL